MTQVMHLVVGLEEEASSYRDLAVPKPSGRHGDNLSLHELTRTEHLDHAGELLRTKQCLGPHTDRIIASILGEGRRCCDT